MGKAIDDAWRDPSKLGSFSFYNVSNGRSEVPTQLPSQPLIHVDIPAQSRYPIYSSSTPIFIYQSTDNSAVSIRANLPTLTNRTAPRTQFYGTMSQNIGGTSSSRPGPQSYVTRLGFQDHGRIPTAIASVSTLRMHEQGYFR